MEGHTTASNLSATSVRPVEAQHATSNIISIHCSIGCLHFRPYTMTTADKHQCPPHYHSNSSSPLLLHTPLLTTIPLRPLPPEPDSRSSRSGARFRGWPRSNTHVVPRGVLVDAEKISAGEQALHHTQVQIGVQRAIRGRTELQLPALLSMGSLEAHYRTLSFFVFSCCFQYHLFLPILLEHRER
jgi:hypothetical protein